MTNRRDFLSRVASTTLGGAVLHAWAGSGEAASVVNESIPQRLFGKTGRKLPILGYGGAALVRAWAGLQSVDERIGLVRYAYQRGVRYFDTARNYQESQWVLGQALKDVRKDVFLVTKVETTDPAKVRRAVGILRESFRQ